MCNVAEEKKKEKLRELPREYAFGQKESKVLCGDEHRKFGVPKVFARNVNGVDGARVKNTLSMQSCLR